MPPSTLTIDMRIPLALYNLAQNRLRTAVAIAGVSFALIMIFLQLAFVGAAEETADLQYSRLDFDVLLMSSEYVELNRAHRFSSRRLAQVQANPAVRSATPLYVGYNVWRDLQEGEAKSVPRWPIMIIAYRPGDHVLNDSEAEQAADRLKLLDNVLIDRNSRSYFGPQARADGQPVVAELGGRRIKIVGQVTIGTGFGANGLVLMSERTFADIFKGLTLDSTSLGLIKLKDGADPEQTVAQLRAALPDDVHVYTRAAILEREQQFWDKQTSVGAIFNFGVLVALIVGIVFVYQVMSSDIGNRLAEYATLKAIGNSNSYVSLIVLQQSMCLAVLGYVPALLISLGLYALTAAQAHLPMDMTSSRALGVFALAVAMCALSGLLALRKVWAADPAELY
jgi:putative ABC transport system permease protein